MKRVLLMVFVLTLLVPVGLTHAQVPGTKEDNACNEGGALAGKCDTEWEWVCGYYLARWENAGGWNIPNNVLNTACISLLPPRPQSSADTAIVQELCPAPGLCLYSNGVFIADVPLGGPIETYAIHTTGPIPASCPLTYAGKPYNTSGPVSASSLAFWFTPQQLADFGWTTNFCEYL